MAGFQIKAVLITALLPGLILISSPSLRAEEPASEIAAPTVKPAADVDKGVEGTAAVYAKRYNNRRTSSGQRYNPSKLTAAHPTLPLGSKVKVVNLANDKEVIVTINDRCRRKSKPFIDLSRTAASQLGLHGRKTANVRIISLIDAARTDAADNVAQSETLKYMQR